jgi:hypothetical protein
VQSSRHTIGGISARVSEQVDNIIASVLWQNPCHVGAQSGSVGDLVVPIHYVAQRSRVPVGKKIRSNGARGTVRDRTKQKLILAQEVPPLGAEIEVMGMPPVRQCLTAKGRMGGTGTVVRATAGAGFAAAVVFHF